MISIEVVNDRTNAYGAGPAPLCWAAYPLYEGTMGDIATMSYTVHDQRETLSVVDDCEWVVEEQQDTAREVQSAIEEASEANEILYSDSTNGIQCHDEGQMGEVDRVLPNEDVCSLEPLDYIDIKVRP